MRKHPRVGFVLLLFLFSTFCSAQGNPSSELLLELTDRACPSGGSGCFTNTLRVYSDGRCRSEEISYERAKSGKYREVSSTEEKTLEPEELKDLLSSAEQTEFQSAQPEYTVASARHPTILSITYRNIGREKKVTIINFNAGTAEEKAKVPKPIRELMKRAFPYTYP